MEGRQGYRQFCWISSIQPELGQKAGVASYRGGGWEVGGEGG